MIVKRINKIIFYYKEENFTNQIFFINHLMKVYILLKSYLIKVLNLLEPHY